MTSAWKRHKCRNWLVVLYNKVSDWLKKWRGKRCEKTAAGSWSRCGMTPNVFRILSSNSLPLGLGVYKRVAMLHTYTKWPCTHTHTQSTLCSLSLSACIEMDFPKLPFIFLTGMASIGVGRGMQFRPFKWLRALPLQCGWGAFVEDQLVSCTRATQQLITCWAEKPIRA